MLCKANKDKFVAVVSRKDVEAILKTMRHHSLRKDSQIIGEVIQAPKQKVISKTKIGG
ncbi:MAG: hypothetical protein KJ887_07325 [Candidatus Omnitrophica bacterium]|nr:hypothetical protein [Candidatus Omnitrophota bacterium]MBU1889855.1 hypothetical protein [Candidatus Omnitrophota bacterium]